MTSTLCTQASVEALEPGYRVYCMRIHTLSNGKEFKWQQFFHTNASHGKNNLAKRSAGYAQITNRLAKQTEQLVTIPSIMWLLN